MTPAGIVSVDATMEWLAGHVPGLDEWLVFTYGKRGRKAWILSYRCLSLKLADQRAKDVAAQCYRIAIVHLTIPSADSLAKQTS